MLSKWSLRDVRNIGVIAHVDAGKTTVTERMNYLTGLSHKIGDIDAGTTVTDFMKQERERGITICSAAVTFGWDRRTINLIDTPGHVDFVMEVQRSLRVLDGAVLVVCAKNRVQTQTKKVMRKVLKHKVSRLILVNKMDHPLGADYFATVDSINDRLGIKATVLQVPIGSSHDFRGVVDLITRKAYIWAQTANQDGRDFEVVDVPAELSARVEELRDVLVQDVVEADDDLMTRYLEGQEISEAELKAALRQGVISQRITPVLCGSAKASMGIQPLLDAVCDYLPSPLDRPAVTGRAPDGTIVERAADDNAPLSALVFKLMDDQFGVRYFTRVYSGVLRSDNKGGDKVINLRTGNEERPTLKRMIGNKMEPISELRAGDIGVLVGLDDALTGDTLCSKQHPIALETIECPDPVISLAVRGKAGKDTERLPEVLYKLRREDPSFRFHTDAETGEIIIEGLGSLHLDVKLTLAKEDHKCETVQGKPQVAYRGTISRRYEAEMFRYVKQSGGSGQFACVQLVVEPIAGSDPVEDAMALPGANEFVDEIVGGAIASEFIKSVFKGLASSMDKGPIGGYPVTGVRIRLVDGKMHDVDSSDTAFQLAASMAFKAAFAQAAPILLEPIVSIDVELANADHMRVALGLIASRRGSITGQELVNGTTVVSGTMPLGETFDLSTALRSGCAGDVEFTLDFKEYAPVPASLAEEVLKERAERQAAK